MKNKDLKFYVIIAILALACVFSWSYYFHVYSQKDTVDIKQFPKQIRNWSSEDLIITEEEYAILETRNAFARKYFTPDGKAVLLYIIYSQNNRKVSHPPEVCYTGSGMSVLSHSTFTVPGMENQKFDEPKMAKNLPLRINRLMLERGQSKEVSFYWFKVGDKFTPSYWGQQFLIAIKTLSGKKSSSAMIRVSAAVLQEDVKKAESDTVEFIQMISPKLFTFLP
jgi:EpsI family protein